MKNLVLPILIAIFSLTGSGMGANLILDSFTEGPFALSTGGTTGEASTNTGEIGTRRVVSVSDRNLSPGTVLTSTLSTNMGGSLALSIDGMSSGLPLNLMLSYLDGGPYSILGSTAFEFDFSSLIGVGSLFVELGSASNPGPETTRIAITSPGVVTLSFSELNFGTNGSVNSFNALHVTFEAVSEEFSFQLEEIRLVPEPSSVLFLGLGGVWLLLCRKRVGSRMVMTGV